MFSIKTSLLYTKDDSKGDIIAGAFMLQAVGGFITFIPIQELNNKIVLKESE